MQRVSETSLGNVERGSEHPLLETSDALAIQGKRPQKEEEEEKEEARARLKPDEEGTGGKKDDEEEFPDGGWGWVVTLGCFAIAASVNTIGPCFGILFSRFLTDLGTSSANVAWVFNARAFTLCLTQVLLGPLVEEFGWRKVAFVAGLLVAVGIGASGFATSALYLLFSYSLLTGIGSGLEVGLIFTIIPNYFSRRRGVANALMNLGISCGQMLGPLLISYLQGLYGFVGSTLVLSAAVLHCCVGALVFHPIEWHTKTRRPRAVRERGGGALVATSRFFRNVLLNFKLLRSPQVLIIAIGSALNTTGFLNFLMMAPFAIQAQGYSVEEASWCMSVFGLCNLVTRMTVSSLTDWPRFSKRGCYMTGTATALCFVVIFSLVHDLTLMKVAMGFWGCGVGSFMGIHSLIMVDYVGLVKLVPMLGVSGVFNCLCFIVIGPVLGVIRDVSQSYAVSMWALSCTFAITFCLWLLMPFAVAYDKRREQREQKSAEP